MGLKRDQVTMLRVEGTRIMVEVWGGSSTELISGGEEKGGEGRVKISARAEFSVSEAEKLPVAARGEEGRVGRSLIIRFKRGEPLLKSKGHDSGKAPNGCPLNGRRKGRRRAPAKKYSSRNALTCPSCGGRGGRKR